MHFGLPFKKNVVLQLRCYGFRPFWNSIQKWVSDHFWVSDFHLKIGFPKFFMPSPRFFTFKYNIRKPVLNHFGLPFGNRFPTIYDFHPKFGFRLLWTCIQEKHYRRCRICSSSFTAMLLLFPTILWTFLESHSVETSSINPARLSFSRFLMHIFADLKNI